MDKWQITPEMQAVERALADQPKPKAPPGLRQAVLTDPRAVAYFASCKRVASHEAKPLVDISPCGVDGHPLPVFPSSTGHYLGEQTFSYVKSLVIICLLTATSWYFSSMDYPRIGQSSITATGMTGTRETWPSITGRVTGAIDCVWDKNAVATPCVDYVTIGQQIALESGLLEITYNDGSKVILVGPVRYDVCSDGGFLSSGKLVATLKAKRNRSKGSEGQSRQADSGRRRLVVRTPSNGVFAPDDTLEIGIKVDPIKRETLMRVFSGQASLCSPFDAGDSPWHVLMGNESACLSWPEPGEHPEIRRASIHPKEFSYRVGYHRWSEASAADHR